MDIPKKPPRTMPVIFLTMALCLCCAGTARAGDGGGDAGTIQSFLNTICQSLGFTVPPTPDATCPQLPTVTQGTLEIAGLGYARPEAIRRSQNVSPGSVFASNPPPIPGSTRNPIVPLTLPVTPSAFANLALTPLAFISPENEEDPQGSTPSVKTAAYAPVTQLYDRDANRFFYAVTTYDIIAGQPKTLNLFYDDLSRNYPFFAGGQQVAKISLPLVVYDTSACMFASTGSLAGCAETEVPTVLDIRATCTGGANCLTAYAIADFSAFGTQKCSSLIAVRRCIAADLGVSFAVVFGASPTSSHPHSIFEVQVPLVVTFADDPVHFNLNFNSPQTMLSIPKTFGYEDLGSPLAFLPGKVIGVATYPAPKCPGPTCPSPTSTFQSNFGFCASLPDNNNHLRPAVAAFLDIATDGEVLASAPLGSSTSPTLQCPF